MSDTADRTFTSAAELPWAPKPPGHFIRADILEAHGLTQDALARALGVHRRTVNELVGARRELTVDMARRLSELTGQSAEYWRALQTQYDLWRSRQEVPSYDIRPLSEVTRSEGESRGRGRAGGARAAW